MFLNHPHMITAGVTIRFTRLVGHVADKEFQGFTGLNSISQARHQQIRQHTVIKAARADNDQVSRQDCLNSRWERQRVAGFDPQTVDGAVYLGNLAFPNDLDLCILIF